MSKEVIVDTDIPRENGFLYCCGTNENGCLTILKVRCGKGRKPKKKIDDGSEEDDWKDDE